MGDNGENCWNKTKVNVSTRIELKWFYCNFKKTNTLLSEKLENFDKESCYRAQIPGKMNRKLYLHEKNDTTYETNAEK